LVVQLRTEGLTWHVAGDEVVVLDLGGSVYLKLNGSGRVIWERLATPCNEDDLVAALLDAFDDVDRERAAADVSAFLADLRQRNLVVA
jgi:Coenzyme PQQ synthesis protein D (PqqD)